MSERITGISVVIPALNEEAAIADTVRLCSETLNAWRSDAAVPFEVIVVDDGSRDRTAELAKAAGAKVLRHPANGGYGLSLKDGIKAASYDTIVMTDADGTYPVGDLPKLLEAYLEGFDMVVGARTGKHYRQSPFKALLRLVLKLLVEWAAGKPIADINSGFRVFSKSTVQNFFQHLCDTFSFTTSVTLAYMMTGCFIAYVPTDYYPRVGSSHVRLLKDSVRTIMYIMRQILYFDPLKIFLLFSVCWCLFAIPCFLVSTLAGLRIGYFLGILSIFGAFIMVGIGLLAEQVRQVIVNTGTHRKQ